MLAEQQAVIRGEHNDCAAQDAPRAQCLDQAPHHPVHGEKGFQDALPENLQALQKGKGGPTSTILTAEQQGELENFRKKAAETRRDLKELRKNLRVETDALEFWTKVFNIGLVPLLVALAGIVLALGRRRRQAARAA